MSEAARMPQRIGSLRWIPLTAPPLVFLVTLGTQYMLGALPCDVRNEWRWVSLIIPAVPLALSVWILFLSRSRLATDRDSVSANNGGPAPIDRAIMFVALFCVIASIALWPPPLLLSCR